MFKLCVEVSFGVEGALCHASSYQFDTIKSLDSSAKGTVRVSNFGTFPNELSVAQLASYKRGLNLAITNY